MKKKFLYLLILAISFFGFTTNGYAASLGISSSSRSVVKGGSVKVTVNANGLIGKFSITSSNGGVLSGGTGSVWLENESKTYTFKANSTGSATITVKALDVSDTSGNSYSGSRSVSINVVNPREKSTNNNLKSLSVEGYTLSPEFNKDTLEYTVELDASVEKIKVNAEKADSYASLSGGGEIAVSEGDNRIEIKVTSETGKEKTYVINAIVKDNNPITVEVDDKKLTVVKKASLLSKPDQFEEINTVIGEIGVPSFYNKTTDTTLVGLRDEEGKIELYIYDEKQNSYRKYLSLASTGLHLIEREAKNIPEGYQKITKKIDDVEYTAYQKDKSEFLLLYGIILENGNEGWYSYDTKEKTFQRYNVEEIKNMENEYQEKNSTDKKVIIGLGILSAFLALTTIALALKKQKVYKQALKNQNETKEKKQISKKKQQEEEKKENKKKK